MWISCSRTSRRRKYYSSGWENYGGMSVPSARPIRTKSFPKPDVILTHESDLAGLLSGVLFQRLARKLFNQITTISQLTENVTLHDVANLDHFGSSL